MTLRTNKRILKTLLTFYLIVFCSNKIFSNSSCILIGNELFFNGYGVKSIMNFFDNIKSKKKNFKSKLIIPKLRDYKKIKYKIKNSYLASNINDENVSFVFELSKIMNISQKSFVKSIQSFKGLEHRFEIFMKKKNVTFINDSKATTCESAITAISGLKNIFWILGGLPKKGDKINLFNYKKNIIKCYLIGKNINFFKKQVEGKVFFSISKTLNRAINQIVKDHEFYKKKKCFILLLINM